MRRLVNALSGALAVFAVGASAASADGPAPAYGGASLGGATIKTELQPGWNMVGWLGPETPVSELFDLIPALERVSVWVGGDRRYERATRNNPSNRRLSPLTPGRGFWMYIGGTATIEWIRPVIPGPVLLSLHAGRNLVGWTGPDGIPIQEALARFGDALTILWRWNAETQQCEHYRPGVADSANTLRELHLGDALWVDLSSDARWLQSGTANAEFVFRGYVTPEVQSGIRAMTGRVMTHFAERYGIEPPRFTVITVSLSSDSVSS